MAIVWLDNIINGGKIKMIMCVTNSIRLAGGQRMSVVIMNLCYSFGWGVDNKSTRCWIYRYIDISLFPLAYCSFVIGKIITFFFFILYFYFKCAFPFFHFDPLVSVVSLFEMSILFRTLLSSFHTYRKL